MDSTIYSIKLSWTKPNQIEVFHMIFAFVNACVLPSELVLLTATWAGCSLDISSTQSWLILLVDANMTYVYQNWAGKQPIPILRGLANLKVAQICLTGCNIFCKKKGIQIHKKSFIWDMKFYVEYSFHNPIQN